MSNPTPASYADLIEQVLDSSTRPLSITLAEWHLAAAQLQTRLQGFEVQAVTSAQSEQTRAELLRLTSQAASILYGACLLQTRKDDTKAPDQLLEDCTDYTRQQITYYTSAAYLCRTEARQEVVFAPAPADVPAPDPFDTDAEEQLRFLFELPGDTNIDALHFALDQLILCAAELKVKGQQPGTTLATTITLQEEICRVIALAACTLYGAALTVSVHPDTHHQLLDGCFVMAHDDLTEFTDDLQREPIDPDAPTTPVNVNEVINEFMAAQAAEAVRPKTRRRTLN